MNWQTTGMACALVAALASGAQAEIIGGGVTGGTSGGVFEWLAPPPPAVGPNVIDSPNLIAFNERQDVEILSPLSLSPSLTLGTGSVVSSHYVFFDPEIGSTMEGTVLFDEPILGILGAVPELDHSETFFGAPGTIYSTVSAIGPDPADNVFVSLGDPNRLVFQGGALSPGDHVRVITGVAVPEPSMWLLMLIGGVAFTATAPREVTG